LPEAGVLSLDARGHGDTTLNRENSKLQGATAQDDAAISLDLRLDTLSSDLVFVVTETQSQMRWETLPDVILVGHSLGGAVVTHVAKRYDLGSKLLAYAVLDVVEGMSIAHSI
jgi:protein phosphatase methylesterase 1